MLGSAFSRAALAAFKASGSPLAVSSGAKAGAIIPAAAAWRRFKAEVSTAPPGTPYGKLTLGECEGSDA